MAAYRLYFFERHIARAPEMIEAFDDQKAIELATDHITHGYDLELWDSRRLVMPIPRIPSWAARSLPMAAGLCAK